MRASLRPFVMVPGAAALALLACLSCGTSDDAAPEGPIEAACAQYAAARCGALERCAPVLLRADFGTRESCETQLQGTCLYTAALPGATLKSSTVSACASTFSSVDCAGFQARLDLPFCDGAGGGTVAPGSACVSGYQCDSRACFLDPAGWCGTCQPAVAVGGGCRTSLDCPAATTCSGYHCLPASGVGGPCDATHACGGYLICREGTCQPSPAEGEACTPGGCSNKLGLDCDAATNKCKAIALIGDGESCGSSGGAQAYCEARGACIQGSCEGAVPEGRPCDASVGPYCQLPAVCTGGWCKVPDSATCP